jgi:superkiller protein 3
MSPTLRHYATESFAPVLLVLLVLSVALLYAEFRTARDADEVTVIHIGTTAHNAVAAAEPEVQDDTPQLSAADNADPRYAEAARLAEAGRWRQAEAKYQAILADGPRSQAFNDLGAMYLRKGDRQKALSLFNRASATPPIYSRVHFNRALAYGAEGRYAEAIADYATFVREVPHHVQAHYNLGLTYLKARDPANAVRALETAVGLAGGERKARASHALGLAYRGVGAKDKARAAFNTAIRLAPIYLEPRFGLASLEDDTPKGRERALAHYEKIFALKPDYPPAYFNMALLHAANGRSTAAEDAYRKALQHDPEYLKARYNLGLLLLAGKRYADARSEFEHIIKREPAHVESRFSFARAAYGQKDYATALREYGRAIEQRGGRYPEAYLNLGLAHVALKHYGEAEAAYRKALQVNEKYPEAWYNLGLAQMKQDHFDQAVQSFRTAIKHEPRYAQAWFNLAVLYGREDRDNEAIEAYRQALAVRPDYPQARLNLAVRYARLERHTEAIREYRALLAQDDTYALAWLNLGIAYQETKDHARAEDALRHALALEPNSVNAMKRLARTLAEQRQYDKAIEVLNQAVSADAGDARLRLQLARVLRDADEPAAARVQYEKALRLEPENDKARRELMSLPK